MVRALAVAVFAALAVAGVASAAYPGTYGLQGGPPLGAITVTKGAGGTAISAGDRRVSIPGAYGIPTLITANTPLGMFRDRSRFVLQSLGIERQTSFAVVRTTDFGIAQTISLKGSYAFDALSPNGRMLYLVEHRSSDFQHYVVRAYDLRARRLEPGRIADKEQASWVMQGWPAARVESGDGRWVYTLYANPGGSPFVHALDTVRGVAHCVGFAWHGDAQQNDLLRYHLGLDGNRLIIRAPDQSLYRAIDRTTWAVSLG
jgi:hypothetical protein